MSSLSSGLTRRRAQTPATIQHLSSDADLTDPPTSTPLSDTPKSTSANNGNKSNTTLLPNGTLMAWDPDEIILQDDYDIVPFDDPKKVPDLTLMEQVLLLGIKDRQGYLSFWNDSLSYVLRGTILMELAIRGRIAIMKSSALPRSCNLSSRSNILLQDRPIAVINSRLTGETLLDETLRLILKTQDGTYASAQQPATGSDFTTKSNDPATNGQTSNPGSCEGQYWGVGTWMDLLSGETWNILRVSYQLRQVRERLAKGLVDKGVLRTERKSFVIFDMATHPIANINIKNQVYQNVLQIVQTPLKSGTGWPPNTSLRDICLVSCCHAGNVLENVLVRLPNLGDREHAWARADELLAQFSKWNFPSASANNCDSKVLGIDHLEVVAAVMTVFARMDSLL